MLDEIDKKILQSLSADSRQSIEKLSEEVCLSPTPVRRRVKKLEDDGIIQRYTLNVDMKKLGYALTVFAFVKLQGRDRVTLARFEEKICDLKEVSNCALVTGQHDYLLTMRFETMEVYNTFLRNVLAELPGVFGIETSVMIAPVKDEIPLPR
ncbi:MAG: Lrp/AsnC family transcriptional regulator [Pseudomonadota bacterium]